MNTAKWLAVIAAGYALSIAGGLAVVALNEAFMPQEISQTSGGMVAFGDMILFVLATGFLALVPTWFLLKLMIKKAPHALYAAAVAIVALGPASWLAMFYLASVSGPAGLSGNLGGLAGLLIAFVAIPRIVAGPVLLVIEGVSVLLAHGRRMRALLGAAMLLDLVPLSLFALHMARAMRH